MENSVGYQDFELRPVFPSSLDSVEVEYTTGYVSVEGKEKTLYKSGDYTIIINE